MVIDMGNPSPALRGRGSQKREPACSGFLRLTATYSERSCRWEAPRSTLPDCARLCATRRALQELHGMQEVRGSNPVAPRERPGHGPFWGLGNRLPRFFDRHLTVI